MLPVARQALGDLLRRGHAQVGNYTAMQRAGIVEINNLAHKVGAVRRQEFVAASIRGLVQQPDQLVIFLFASLDLERVERAVVSRTHQLAPRSLGHLAVIYIWSNGLQIFPPILIPQKSLQPGIGVDRNLFGFVDRVEVRDQRNRVPIVSGDAVVAAEHCSLLARLAATHDQRSLSTDPVEVNRHVPGSGKGSVDAVGLLKQKSGARVRSQARTPKHQDEDPPGPKTAHTQCKNSLLTGKFLSRTAACPLSELLEFDARGGCLQVTKGTVFRGNPDPMWLRL